MKTFYYEFDEHEYYGLVAVSVEANDFEMASYKKAIQHYVDVIGGDSVEAVEEEAMPNLRTKEYAFMRFMYAPNTLDLPVHKMIEEFEETTDGVLLIDGSLL